MDVRNKQEVLLPSTLLNIAVYGVNGAGFTCKFHELEIYPQRVRGLVRVEVYVHEVRA